MSISRLDLGSAGANFGWCLLFIGSPVQRVFRVSLEGAAYGLHLSIHSIRKNQS